MPRHDPVLLGPEVMGVEDIEALNRLFTEAFTDRYHRDGMTGVRVPPLSRSAWRYAIASAGAGAQMWRDAEGDLAAFCLVHRSGTEGWLGPLAIRTDLQGYGLGRMVVRHGIERLQQAGARVIGLETMPRTVENVGFYSGLGLVPRHLTVSLTRDLTGYPASTAGARRLSEVGDQDASVAACRGLTDRVSPGVDFSPDLRLTLEQGLGDATLLGEGSDLRAFALWHTAPLAQGRGVEEVRLLKVVATDLPAFLAVVDAAAAHARLESPVRRVMLRCQTAFADAYARLVAAGFRVHWTDLRMTLLGHEEQVVSPGILMSNWEV